MSKYDSGYAILAERLCRTLHATDEQLAAILDVDRSCINQWKLAHPEFREALQRGKTDADSEVKAALFKRAVGYSVTKEKVCTDKGASWVERYEDPIPGDVTAQIFWLCNRDPQNWRQKQTTEHELVKPISLAYPLPERPHLLEIVGSEVDVTQTAQKAG